MNVKLILNGITLIALTVCFISCEHERKSDEIKGQVSDLKKSAFGLVIHGGAGNIYKERYTAEQEKCLQN